MQDYKDIRVTGPISLEKVTEKLPVWSSRTMYDRDRKEQRKYTAGVLYILTPQDRRHFRFLECLVNDHSLGLSKNQLESVTQQVNCYGLVNVKKKSNFRHARFDAPIYLVDTSGLSDRMDIVVDRALYFERITDTCVSVSRKRAQRLFEMRTSEKAAGRVTISTIMWDALCTDAQKDKAKRRFEEYRSSHWKDFISRGTTCTKFYNNQESALELLDHACRRLKGDNFIFESNLYTGQDIQKAPYVSYLLEQLMERMVVLEGQIWVVTEELSQESTTADVDMCRQLTKDKRELELMLANTHREMEDFVELSESEVSSSRRILKWF
ncbi:hypothetical protein BJ165DRAFT_1535446 [Panaeolus papilionaceus]|nr:hypothetical protein BJ165DRAFT_1535446 [Panaeolus papilionaceus]